MVTPVDKLVQILFLLWLMRPLLKICYQWPSRLTSIMMLSYATLGNIPLSWHINFLTYTIFG